MMRVVSGIALVASRRNIAAERAARAAWKLAHSEDHPLRYRLHYPDGTRNIRTGRLGLLAEIRETKPVRIERLPQKGDEMRFATVAEHLAFLGEMRALKVCD